MSIATKPLPPLEALAEMFELDPGGHTGLRSAQTKRPAGYLTAKGYARVHVPKMGQFAVHRIVWSLANGKLIPHDMFVDHINGERADNRPENLRICTNAENLQNMKGATGVHWMTVKQRWRAVIFVNYRRIILGNFTSREAASEAYQKAKRELHPYSQQAMQGANHG